MPGFVNIAIPLWILSRLKPPDNFIAWKPVKNLFISKKCNSLPVLHSTNIIKKLYFRPTITLPWGSTVLKNREAHPLLFLPWKLFPQETVSIVIKKYSCQVGSWWFLFKTIFRKFPLRVHPDWPVEDSRSCCITEGGKTSKISINLCRKSEGG